MKTYACSLVLVVCLLACLAESVSLHGASVKRRGPAVLSGPIPWQVSVVMDVSNFCSGSIISSTWIISSGFCADGYHSYVITAGSVSSFGGTESSKQLFLTTEAYRHPQFSGKSFYDNDISLIRLLKKVQFSDVVSPIRLPSFSLALDSTDEMPIGVVGWGTTKNPKNGVHIRDALAYVTPKIADDSTCRKAYGNVIISTKRCFVESSCTIIDPGSSVSVQFSHDLDAVLMGVVSGDPQEACANGQPILFTSVPHFLGFIEFTTNIAIED